MIWRVEISAVTIKYLERTSQRTKADKMAKILKFIFIYYVINIKLINYLN
jgi:hypothetical protein